MMTVVDHKFNTAIIILSDAIISFHLMIYNHFIAIYEKNAINYYENITLIMEGQNAYNFITNSCKLNFKLC